MANFYEDNSDLSFYVEHGIDWEPIVRLTEYEFNSPDGFTNVEEALEFYRDVLKMVGQFSAEEIAPIAAELEQNHGKLVDGEVVDHPKMDELFDKIKELGLHGMTVPRELGGMSAPFILFMLNTEVMSRADVSISAHHGFHGGIAMALILYSVMEGTTEFDMEKMQISKTRFDEEIAEIIAGDAWGSMDITEPHAGSDMAALRARGEQDEDGNWFVTGEKIFITSGHGKYHIVIAKTEKDEEGADSLTGLDTLSLFLVPAWHDEDGKRVRTGELVSLEEKLGHRSSATVAISFDNSPAKLIGKRGDGFKLMLLLMNNARIGVGFECIGVMEAALRQAKAYAAERPSMGKTIDKHEMIADYLEEMQTDLQGIRAIAVKAAEYEEVAQKLNLKLMYWPPTTEGEREALEAEHRRMKRKTRRLTPLLKYIAAEKAVQMAQRNIQIHGGAGYINETGAEKLLRDAMVMPIYEGTSQIQALMAMKDNLLYAVRHPQSFMRKAAQARWRSVSSRDMLERRLAKLQTYEYSTLQFLLSRLATEKVKDLRNHPVGDWAKMMTGWDPKRDFALAMLHAERLIKIITDVAICETLYEQAKKHPERAPILERYMERAEPRVRYLHDEITTTGLRLLAELNGEEPETQAEAS